MLFHNCLKFRGNQKKWNFREIFVTFHESKTGYPIVNFSLNCLKIYSSLNSTSLTTHARKKRRLGLSEFSRFNLFDRESVSRNSYQYTWTILTSFTIEYTPDCPIWSVSSLRIRLFDRSTGARTRGGGLAARGWARPCGAENANKNESCARWNRIKKSSLDIAFLIGFCRSSGLRGS